MQTHGTCHDQTIRLLPFEYDGQAICLNCADRLRLDSDDQPTGVEPVRRFYAIPDANMPALADRLAKLNRKAGKLGTVPATVDTVGTHEEIVRERSESTGQTIERTEPYTLLTVKGQAPRVKGYAFVATLDHAGEAGNILRTVPGFDRDLPAAFRSATPACDHCKLARRRNDTFILYRESDGAFLQVGRNCLGDFLGGISPEGLVASMQWLLSLGTLLEAGEDDLGGGRGRERGYFKVAFLASVAAHVRTLGWLSRTLARERGETATVNLVETTLDPRHKCPRDRRCTTKNGIDQHPATTEADEAEAQAALDWFEAEIAPRDDLSDYFWNLKVVLSGESIAPRGTGLAASLIGVYQREMGKLAEQKARAVAKADSEHVGTPGKRGVFQVTVVGSRDFESAYGARTLYTFQDAAGNVIKWWASAGHDRMADGEALTIKATVKEHGDYKGIRETTVQRVERVVEQAEATTTQAEATTLYTALAEAQVALQEAETAARTETAGIADYSESSRVYNERTQAAREALHQASSDWYAFTGKADKATNRIIQKVATTVDEREDLVRRRQAVAVQEDARVAYRVRQTTEARAQGYAAVVPGDAPALVEIRTLLAEAVAKLETLRAEAERLGVTLPAEKAADHVSPEHYQREAEQTIERCRQTYDRTVRALVQAHADAAGQEHKLYLIDMAERQVADAAKGLAHYGIGAEPVDLAAEAPAYVAHCQAEVERLRAEQEKAKAQSSSGGYDSYRSDYRTERLITEADAALSKAQALVATLWQGEQPASPAMSLQEAAAELETAWMEHSQHMAQYSQAPQYSQEREEATKRSATTRERFYSAQVMVRRAGGDPGQIEERLIERERYRAGMDWPKAQATLEAAAERYYTTLAEINEMIGPESSDADKSAAVDMIMEVAKPHGEAIQAYDEARSRAIRYGFREAAQAPAGKDVKKEMAPAHLR